MTLNNWERKRKEPMKQEIMRGRESVDFVRTRKRWADILGVSVRTLVRKEQRKELERVQITQRLVGYRTSAIERSFGRIEP